MVEIFSAWPSPVYEILSGPLSVFGPRQLFRFGGGGEDSRWYLGFYPEAEEGNQDFPA